MYHLRIMAHTLNLSQTRKKQARAQSRGPYFESMSTVVIKLLQTTCCLRYCFSSRSQVHRPYNEAKSVTTVALEVQGTQTSMNRDTYVLIHVFIHLLFDYTHIGAGLHESSSKLAPGGDVLKAHAADSPT